jgi:hypothetical protein
LLENVLEQPGKMLSKKLHLTRKFDIGIYEKVVNELCPSHLSEKKVERMSDLLDGEMIEEELTHEFTFMFRLLTLNLPNFELEVQLGYYYNEDQTVKYKAVS